MVYKKLWLVVLAEFLFSIASCNGAYTYGSNEDQQVNEFLKWLEELPFFVRILLGLAIDATLFVILYISVRLCCPTCCSKRRPGVILNVTDIVVSEVQPLTDGHSRQRMDWEMK